MGFEERRIGTIIGKWRVDSLLGSGSMAAVYGVTHRNGSRAALKILHPKLCTEDAVIERFLSEGYLANVVKHPGIVRVFDDGMTDEGCPFLAMEMLEGETLEDYLEAKGPKLPLETALSIADGVMDVLAAVHAGGVIHRDLKPSNVFLTSSQEIKLLDFGIAKLSEKQSVSKLSLVGMVLGTPAYMAPEQAAGDHKSVDLRSDIFGIGAIMFTMLSGENVHNVEGVQQKLVAAATVKARSLASVCPDLPPGIVAVVDRALGFKKDDRWQTVSQMRTALKEAAEHAKARHIDLPPPSNPRVTSTEHVADGGRVEEFQPIPDPFATRLMAPPLKTLSGLFPEDQTILRPSAKPSSSLMATKLGLGHKPADAHPADDLDTTQFMPPGRVGAAGAPPGDELDATQFGMAPIPGMLHDEGPDPTTILPSNPYFRASPPIQAQLADLETSSGRRVAPPDVTDSGRMGFFYAEPESGNGSYPPGAAPVEEPTGLPRKNRWVLPVALAAVIAMVAGAGVYVQRQQAIVPPLAPVPSAPSSVSPEPAPSSAPLPTAPTSPPPSVQSPDPSAEPIFELPATPPPKTIVPKTIPLLQPSPPRVAPSTRSSEPSPMLPWPLATPFPTPNPAPPPPPPPPGPPNIELQP